jgi:hypothetical protein
MVIIDIFNYIMFFAVMSTPLDYVRPELFDEAVDRQNCSYVSVVLGHPLGAIRCRTTRTLVLIHSWWISKYVIHIYYLFPFPVFLQQ